MISELIHAVLRLRTSLYGAVELGAFTELPRLRFKVSC